MIYIYKGTAPVNKLWVADLEALAKDTSGHPSFADYDMTDGQLKLPFTRLVDDFGGAYHYVSNDGVRFVFHTNRDAPRYKLVSIDISAEAAEWQASCLSALGCAAAVPKPSAPGRDTLPS